MINIYYNQQNSSENCSDKENIISGLYAYIIHNSHTDICSSNISGGILSRNSSIVVDYSTNISGEHRINASQNSYITDENNASFYNGISNKNSITNFPNDNYIISKSTTRFIDNISAFTGADVLTGTEWLDVISANNKSLSKFHWHKILSNNGINYIWYGNCVNDLQITEKLNTNLSANIIISNLNKLKENSGFQNLQNIFSKYKKNLQGKKLFLNINVQSQTGLNTIYNLDTFPCIICEGFYNGQIVIKFSGKRLPCKFIFYNNENILLDGISSYFPYITNYNESKAIMEFDNNEHVEIINSSFQLSRTTNNISIQNYYTIKNNLFKKFINNQFYTHLYFKNTNAIISNCQFKNCDYISILAACNSKITSISNTFTLNNSSDVKFRKILHYAISNSLINASGCSATVKQTNSAAITYNNSQLQSIQLQQNKNYSNTIFNQYQHLLTVIFGYAYPGSIFNHEHKSHLLAADYYTDNITTNSLPAGSIYQLITPLANKIVDGQYYDLQLSNIVGYHRLDDKQYACIGNTYENGCYNYFIQNSTSAYILSKYQNVMNTFELEALNKDDKTGILPLNNYSKRKINPYIENIKLGYIYKWFLDQSISPYFNQQLLLSASYLSSNIKMSLPESNNITNNFFKPDTNYISVLQYSPFTYYNKDSYLSGEFLSTIENIGKLDEHI